MPKYRYQIIKYKFVTTGEYPLDIPNVPAPPVIEKDPSELGTGKATKRNLE